MDLTEPLEKLIRVGFGIERDAEIEEIEVELDDEEEEEEDAEPDGTIDEDVIDLNALDDEEDEEVKMDNGEAQDG